MTEGERVVLFWEEGGPAEGRGGAGGPGAVGPTILGPGGALALAGRKRACQAPARPLEGLARAPGQANPEALGPGNAGLSLGLSEAHVKR